MKIKKEDLTIKITGRNGGFIESQSVEAILLYEILKKLTKKND